MVQKIKKSLTRKIFIGFWKGKEFVLSKTETKKNWHATTRERAKKFAITDTLTYIKKAHPRCITISHCAPFTPLFYFPFHFNNGDNKREKWKWHSTSWKFFGSGLNSQLKKQHQQQQQKYLERSESIENNKTNKKYMDSNKPKLISKSQLSRNLITSIQFTKK